MDKPDGCRKRSDDADLVARARQGNHATFGAMVERYYAVLMVVGRAYCRNDADASDAVQTAFMLAYVHLGQLKDPAKLGPWLRRLTVNACRQHYRAQKPTVPLDAVAEIRAGDDRKLADATDTRLLLEQALSCLSPETRMTVILYYQREQSLQEIAAFLEVPSTTVKSRLRNARARLRKEMERLLETTLLEEMAAGRSPSDTPRLLRHLEAAGTIAQLAFSPDGTRLVTVATLTVTPEKYESVIACWESATGKPLWSRPHTSWVFCPVFLPDGKRVAVSAGLPNTRGGRDGQILFLDAQTGDTAQTLNNVPGAKTIAVTSDGKHIALGGAEDYSDYRSSGQRGMALLYEVATGKQTLKVTPHLSYVTALALTPDGKTLATSSHLRDADPEARDLWRGGDIRLWDTSTGELRHKLERDDRGTRHTIAFSPNGALLAAPNGTNGEVRLWDATGNLVRNLPGSGEPVFVLAFSPDGSLLACGCGDSCARLWNVETGTLRQTLPTAQCVYAVAFAPNGRTLVTADKNGVTQFWQIA